MNETPRRPWWRLHAVTWLGLLTIGAAMGYANSWMLLFGGNVQSSIGWPLTMGVIGDIRSSPMLRTYEESIPGLRPAGAKLMLAPRRVATNLAVCICVLVGASLAIERASRRRALPRISVRGLLAGTATIAGYVAVLRANDNNLPDDLWYVWMTLGELARFVLYFASAIAWLAFFDVLGIAWDRVTSRRRTTEATKPESALPVSKPL